MMEREPEQRRVTIETEVAGPLEIAVWEWRPSGPDPSGPIVLSHGIGLHGRTWDAIVRQLPSSAWVVAPDLSGHGASQKPPPLPDDGQVLWDDVGREIAAIVRALDLPPALGVGHSMAGHAMIFAAEAAPERFHSLLLLDPTVGDPEQAARPEKPEPRPRPVSRRRSEWSSPDEMFERFRTRAPFEAWDEAVLRDYCGHGLTRSEGGYELSCTPRYESMVWGGRSLRVYEAMAAVQVPVHIARAEPRRESDPPGRTPSQAWPGLHRYFESASDELIEGCGHFFPLEQPALTARLISERMHRQ